MKVLILEFNLYLYFENRGRIKKNPSPCFKRSKYTILCRASRKKGGEKSVKGSTLKNLRKAKDYYSEASSAEATPSSDASSAESSLEVSPSLSEASISTSSSLSGAFAAGKQSEHLQLYS